MHPGASLTQWQIERVNIEHIFKSGVLFKLNYFIFDFVDCFVLGEQNGYNIPEVVSVPNLPLWLSEEGSKELNERYLSDKSLPEHAKRLFCDGYMCMYQTDVMMYR